MKITSLDLNLLTALTALLEEQHVGRAARRIGLSQSAMSEALGRLRRHFGDELLLRVANHYELTPLATGLRPTAATALTVVERVFAAGNVFDPALCEREFVLLTSDYAASVYGRVLLDALSTSAPGARLRLGPLPRESQDSASVAARGVDGFVMPHGMALPGFAGADLFRDRWVCVTGTEHGTGPLTVEAMARARWVVQDTTEHTNPVLAALRALGTEPRVDCVVGDFHSLPHLIAGSDRIAIVPSRMAELWDGTRTRTLAVPFDTPPVVETLWWHVAHDADPAHRWLRETAIAAGARLTEHTTGPAKA